MSSMSFQAKISPNLKPETVKKFHTQTCNKISVFVKPKTSFSETSHSRRQLKIRYSSSLPAIDSILDKDSATEDPSSCIRPEREKLGVVVKPNEKPRLVLKFVWMQNDIGIAIDQVIPGHGTIPLSPYYFWPKKDAWEELKIMLDNKPWISQMEKIHLLNQATDIINLWQEGGGSNA